VRRLLFSLIFAQTFSAVFGLNNDSWDDMLNNAQDEIFTENKDEEPFLNTIIDNLIYEPGFSVISDFSVIGAYYPGWSYSPWDDKFNIKEITQDNQPLGVEMRANVGLRIRVSPLLSFSQTVKLTLPGMNILFTEFYSDYDLRAYRKNGSIMHALFKIGKYDYGWGISPNFPYTDLLSRIPDNSESAGDANLQSPGDLYLARCRIPFGMVNAGDIELIGFTREAYINTVQPELNEFAFGGKLNLAFKWADINIGSVYFKKMPLRAFFSLKTTIFSTAEVYTEGLVSIKHEKWDNLTYSYSFGFANDFFQKRIKINGEMFYNGEDEAKFLRQENPLEDDKKIYPFIPGINFALNLFYKSYFINTGTLGIKFVYALQDGSGQIIPGFTLEPAKHLQLYCAVPIVVGTNSGKSYSFYKKNNDKENRPFSLIFAISLGGHYSFNHF
jgi:hypothetical protein